MDTDNEYGKQLQAFTNQNNWDGLWNFCKNSSPLYCLRSLKALSNSGWSPLGDEKRYAELLKASERLDEATISILGTETEATGHRIWKKPRRDGGVLLLSADVTASILAAECQDGQVHVIESANGTIIQTIAVDKYSVASLQLTPNGRYVAAGSHDAVLGVWETSNGNRIHTLTPVSKGIDTLCITPDGSTLVTGGLYDGMLRVWDLNSGKLQKKLNAKQGWITAIAIDRSGKYLATSGRDDYRVTIWLLPDLVPVETLTSHSDIVTSIIITPDGSRLVTSSLDGHIRIWSAHEEAPPVFIGNPAKDSGHSAIAISQCGNVLAIANKSSIRMWELATNECVATLSAGETEYPYSILFSRDGDVLVGTASGIWKWYAGTRNRIAEWKPALDRLLQETSSSVDAQHLIDRLHHSWLSTTERHWLEFITYFFATHRQNTPETNHLPPTIGQKKNANQRTEPANLSPTRLLRDDEVDLTSLSTLELFQLLTAPLKQVATQTRERAANALVQVGTPETFGLLSDAVSASWKPNQTARTIALQSLKQAPDQKCINTICEFWSTTRNTELESLLVDQGWFSTEPPREEVLSGLLIGSLAHVSAPRSIEYLAEACRDSNATIQKNAVAILSSQNMEKFGSLILKLSIEVTCPILESLVLNLPYALLNRNELARFYLVKRRWSALQEGQYVGFEDLIKCLPAYSRDHLIARLNEAPLVVRQKLLPEPTDGNSPCHHLKCLNNLESLAERKDFEGLWSSIGFASSYCAFKTMEVLLAAGWSPGETSDEFADVENAFRELVGYEWKISSFTNPTKNNIGAQADGRVSLFSPDGNHFIVVNGVWGMRITLQVGADGSISRAREKASKESNFIVNVRRMDDFSLATAIPTATKIEVNESKADIWPGIGTLALSRDGKVLACGGKAPRRLVFTSFPSGAEIARINHPDSGVSTLALSDCGSLAASTSSGVSIYLWEVSTGRLIRRFRCPMLVGALLFGPTRNTLIVGGSLDGKEAIQIWDIPDGSLKSELLLKPSDYMLNGLTRSNDGCYSAAFSERGLQIIAFDESTDTMKVSGTASDAYVSGSVTAANFNPQGTLLAVARQRKGNDGTSELLILVVPELAQAKKISIDSRVLSLSFNEDGTSLFVATEDAVFVWHSRGADITSPSKPAELSDLENRWLRFEHACRRTQKSPNPFSS